MYYLCMYSYTFYVSDYANYLDKDMGYLYYIHIAFFNKFSEIKYTFIPETFGKSCAQKKIIWRIDKYMAAVML